MTLTISLNNYAFAPMPLREPLLLRLAGSLLMNSYSASTRHIRRQASQTKTHTGAPAIYLPGLRTNYLTLATALPRWSRLAGITVLMRFRFGWSLEHPKWPHAAI